jgi:hypothetical protein
MDIIDAVASVLRGVSHEVVEPRFASMADGDSWEKSPGEIVTEADLLAETVIAAHLNELLRRVPVIGGVCRSRPASAGSVARTEVLARRSDRRHGELRGSIAGLGDDDLIAGGWGDGPVLDLATDEAGNVHR